MQQSGTDKSVFSVAHLHCVDALVASARPVGAGKTVANGRSMIAPTAIDLRTGKVGTNGTDKSVPYRVQAKFCTNIEQSLGMRNNMVYAIVPNRDTAKNKSRSRFASKKAKRYGFCRRLDTGLPQ